MAWWLAVAHFFGTRNGDGNSSGYLVWSGAGSDLAYIGVGAAFLRHKNCWVHGCWRLALRHPTEAGHRACRRHHTEGRLTEASLREKYHLYAGSKPGRG